MAPVGRAGNQRKLDGPCTAPYSDGSPDPDHGASVDQSLFNGYVTRRDRTESFDSSVPVPVMVVGAGLLG